jgi:hypothetical protein
MNSELFLITCDKLKLRKEGRETFEIIIHRYSYQKKKEKRLENM